MSTATSSTPQDESNAPAGQQTGVGQVLERVREPTEIGMAHVVEFNSGTKTYNAGTEQDFTTIQNVHFVVADLPNKGEFISVLGPSGCGKSTILRLIAGLAPQHPATSGAVLVLGRPVSGPGADRGMVFQDYTSLDNRTVLENITFGLECLGVGRRERFELGKTWIRRVGLDVDKDADKFPHELSGGMRQRVAIARTLILKPRIILMDEPFGALDPVTRMHMQDLLIELWRDVRATVFFVTHSIEEAVFLGDRAYVMGRAPGTILREMKIEPSDRPAAEMQKEHRFQETVTFLTDLITKLEEPKKA